MTRRFLTAVWKNLVMLNWKIEPVLLKPLVPRGTELDLWQERCFISVVGFQFLRTRVLGIAVPCHCNFEEVNLRFYVRRQDADGWRRGVVFVKEVVPRAAIALIARRVYNERYVACRMASAIRLPDAQRGAGGLVEYRWQEQTGSHALRAEIEGLPALPAPGSEEEFISEHYWGYVAQRDGSTLEYHVEHPPWRVWRATRAQLECDVCGFYGAAYQPALQGPPCSAFVAEGSAVAVYRGERLGD
jgi:uncharacterized protein YqjF (DUF2071 family)